VSKVKPRLVVVTVAPAPKTPTRAVWNSAAALAKDWALKSAGRSTLVNCVGCVKVMAV
jgi:hypothetical protein